MCRDRPEPDSADKSGLLISREQEIAALAAGGLSNRGHRQ
jgi:DNA-binding NarL/FixJ family response regulator